jgi:hypothetical protein
MACEGDVHFFPLVVSPGGCAAHNACHGEPVCVDVWMCTIHNDVNSDETELVLRWIGVLVSLCAPGLPGGWVALF